MAEPSHAPHHAAAQERAAQADCDQPSSLLCGEQAQEPLDIGAAETTATPASGFAYRWLAALAAVLLLAAAGAIALDRRLQEQAAAARSAAIHMLLQSQRFALEAQRARAGEDPAFDRLRAAARDLGAALAALQKTASAFDRARLQALESGWQALHPPLRALDAQRDALNEPQVPGFEGARNALAEIANGADFLLERSAPLVPQRAASPAPASRWMWLGLGCAVAACACLLWILKAMVAEAERRAAENLQSGQHDGKADQRTQQAILRLFDQMSRLAQGDLTVRANVADEVTGAVADALNYAVDELRRLVAGIHHAADGLARACAEAQAASAAMLAASEVQSREIAATAASVAAATRGASGISEHAAASAKVAETSLQAAHEGSVSVRRSVAGIEVIRQQVQETAKRIKRLGESALEIGESVDSIAEIGERTQVAALNAAIQASAANVGRGIGAVADEVRALAERTALAAQQVETAVKAIQHEAQEASAAMERSTARVVEQTQLARTAGQALKRIDEHARHLAQLTDAISAATRAQSEAARRVDGAMGEIARMSELAAEATRKSAARSEQLALLARELNALVRNFKVS